MTNHVDPDNAPKSGRENLYLPFASSDLETAGIRVTRAEFSRMMECSKQAVTDWVKSGRIVVGADGRFDPSRAVRSLLATGDPAKIRARVLAPLVAEMANLRGRITELESALAVANEDAEFYEGGQTELRDVIASLRLHIELGWPQLIDLAPQTVFVALDKWLARAMECAPESAGMLLDHLDVLTDCADLEPCGDAWLDSETQNFLPGESLKEVENDAARRKGSPQPPPSRGRNGAFSR